MKSKYWKSLLYAIVISVLIACITWPVALVFLLACICGCMVDEARIAEAEQKTPEEVEDEREFYNKLRKTLTREQRVANIDAYLKECRRPNENIKWQYDTYPEETQEVLAKYGLIYDAEEQKVKRLKRK
ncbi:MAG: hypothetical protein ACI4EI_06460 [Muricoprocola sp.]